MSIPDCNATSSSVICSLRGHARISDARRLAPRAPLSTRDPSCCRGGTPDGYTRRMMREKHRPAAARKADATETESARQSARSRPAPSGARPSARRARGGPGASHSRQTLPRPCAPAGTCTASAPRPSPRAPIVARALVLTTRGTSYSLNHVQACSSLPPHYSFCLCSASKLRGPDTT